MNVLVLSFFNFLLNQIKIGIFWKKKNVGFASLIITVINQFEHLAFIIYV